MPITKKDMVMRMRAARLSAEKRFDEFLNKFHGTEQGLEIPDDIMTLLNSVEDETEDGENLYGQAGRQSQ